MPEKFDPRQFTSYKELPEEQKSNFKKVKDGFVYKNALSKEDAIVEAEKSKDNNLNKQKNEETLAETGIKGHKRKFHWDQWDERRELNSNIEELENIHPEGLASLIYAPTEAELEECEKNGNVILPYNLPVVLTVENNTQEKQKEKIDQWHNAERDRKNVESMWSVNSRRILNVGEKFISSLKELETSLQIFYGNYNGLFENIKNKKILELAAGQSIASTFPHSGQEYQTQPTVSRILAYCSKKLGLGAEVTAVDLGIDPVIESKYGVKGIREYFENLPYILDEKDKPDIIIMNYWHPDRGAIPEIFKQDTVYCINDSLGGEEFMEEKGFKCPDDEEEGGVDIYWKDSSYRPTFQELKLHALKEKLYNEAIKGVFPTHVRSFTLDNLTPYKNTHKTLKLFEIDKFGKHKPFYDIKSIHKDEALILVQEDCWPCVKKDGVLELAYPNKNLPLFFDVGHLGEKSAGGHETAICPKKLTLYKINLETEKMEKIAEVLFPKIIDGPWSVED